MVLIRDYAVAANLLALGRKSLVLIAYLLSD